LDLDLAKSCIQGSSLDPNPAKSVSKSVNVFGRFYNTDWPQNDSLTYTTACKHVHET